VYTCVDVRCEKSREKKRLPIGQSRDAGRDVTHYVTACCK
jgi:hypothetical protein